jgi:hypothetical protein
VPPAALTSRKRASFQNNSNLTELYHSIGLSVSIVQKLKTKTVNNAEDNQFLSCDFHSHQIIINQSIQQQQKSNKTTTKFIFIFKKKIIIIQ